MQYEDMGPLLWEALQALAAHYGPAINHAAEEVGIPYGEWYGWLMAAHIFAPEPVSARRLAVRSAYTSPDHLDEYLGRGRALGLLEPVAASEYKLTRKGEEAVSGLIQAAYKAMVALQPLPEADLSRLADLLARLVRASLDAPEPPGKWCLVIERHYDPGPDAPTMERMDQYLSDLNAYRDDAHLAAWRPLGVSGQAWESLSFLWRSGAMSLDDLFGRMVRRGYSREAYAAALADLAGRGWVREEAGVYALTGEGQAVRSDAEDLTDRYFYAPWSCLDPGELSELRDLLTRFRDGL